jgi:hypothetical protein
VTAPSGIGALLVGAGAAAWISGAVLELGGHRAVGLMATHANPIQATNSIAFTIDTIGDAFALAAFVLIGAGMLAFAGAALQQRPGHRAWAGYTIVIALAMLVTACAYAAGVGGLSDLMLFADGVMLVPLWLIWTGRAGWTSIPIMSGLPASSPPSGRRGGWRRPTSPWGGR